MKNLFVVLLAIILLASSVLADPTESYSTLNFKPVKKNKKSDFGTKLDNLSRELEELAVKVQEAKVQLDNLSIGDI
jgi:hypothetical protein